MALPDSVTGLVEFSPVEDVLLPILREPLGPGVRVQTLIHKNQQFPLVLVRRLTSFGSGGDPRFVDFARIAIYTYAEGVEGDVDSAHLGEACRVVLRNAWTTQVVVPGRGSISSFRTITGPKRVSDWVPSTGPVQYADLPVGVFRYEAIYDLEIRRPVTS
jgi:hypothetical protein